MKRKIKVKIVLLVIFIILILIAVGVYFIGNSLLTVRVSEDDNPIEVAYKDKEYKLPNGKCSFLSSDWKVKAKNDIDVEKLGEQEITYVCKKYIFSQEKKAIFKIVDKEAPKIKLKGTKSTNVTVNSKYTDPGAEATDEVDGDLTKEIKVEGTVDTSKVGTYELKYTVKDKAGNEATETRTVKVTKRAVSELTCGDAGVIYLTFDDGPNSYFTPVILDVLKKYNVKATFFVTSAGPDELIKREFDEGHAIGLHSSSHEYGIIYRSSEAFWKDMNTVASRVEKITGKKSELIRFPGGSSNTVSRKYKQGIMTQLAREVEEKGYGYFDWNIISGDAGETTDPKVEYNYVINGLSKSRGNVVLMHDIKKHTSEAIESIVKYGIDSGYKFEVLTKDNICHQRILN